jgi:hypothetical protein
MRTGPQTGPRPTISSPASISSLLRTRNCTFPEFLPGLERVAASGREEAEFDSNLEIESNPVPDFDPKLGGEFESEG